jgi:L-serine deaminase
MGQAEHGIRASLMPAYDRTALPVAESSISGAERRRLALIGTAIGLACVAACTLLGVAICAAVFG